MHFFSNQEGQSTVEAAVMLPVFLVVLGLMAQPAILLYDRMVMQSAAAETCRLVETCASDDSAVRTYALRRLYAIPQADVFHIDGDDGWECTFSGGELSGEVEVMLSHHVHPLPLLGVVVGLGQEIDGDGNVVQSVTAKGTLAPAWASAAGKSPGSLIGAWK